MMDLSILPRLTPNRSFYKLVRYANSTLHCEMASISVVAPDSNRFLASHGVPGHLVRAGGCPINDSICAHVAAMGRPLEIADAHVHPLVSHSAIVRDVGIVSYLGYPLHNPGGDSIGAICVCNTRRHDWTGQDRHTLLLLSQIADRVIARALAPVAA